ncbi:MAG: chromosome partition protein MukB [Myxococcales bacterium]|nr:chromosome partition protein MukB [Myxococcales bacterium]
MSRTRVAALVLVNWKGVFYERYLLDRHVTALEGGNGAGKTTVMIAAYVVLLPDMTRLRFTNLGESGATGGDRGIWGRLGEPGRPSYAALDLDLDGERVVLGVCLARTTEPTVVPTAFAITGLSPETRLSELLLVRREDGDHVPELAEIKTAVAAANGSIQIFRTTKDYFAMLFERGITPLRLTREEERNKWNDLLRTSMTGGISRALGTELRSFLLREETGLSDTLSRMRDNLESCRRTRSEVFESRQLEREISAIYEAGLAMFSAALHATRLASVEAQARVRDAAGALERAQHEQAARTEEAAQLAQRESAAGQALEQARAQLAQLEVHAQRRARAAELAERLAKLDTASTALDQQLAAATSAQLERAQARDAAKQARARALEAYDRASRGLADLQQGVAELARRAHAHAELQRCITEARELLDRPQLALDEVAAALEQLTQTHAELETERASLMRQGRDLEARRQEYASALAALDVLEHCDLLTADRRKDTPPSHDRHGLARAHLARLSELEADSARLEQLEEEQRGAQRLATRQRAARELLASLGLELEAAEDPNLVADLLSEVERQQQALESLLHPAPETLLAQQQLDGLRERYVALEQRGACFHLAAKAAERLAQTGLDVSRDSRSALLALRDRLMAEHMQLAGRRDALESEREALQAQAAELGRGGAVYDAELLRVRDELGAELLAARFEDLDAADAAWVEARLGPWVDALVVDDMDATASALTRLPHTLGDVYLVSASQSLDLQPPDTTGKEPLATLEAYGIRLSKLPSPPRLGRRAREARLRELRGAISTHTAMLEELAAQTRQNAELRRDADVLWTHAEEWLGGDPSAQQASLQAQIATGEQQARARQAEQQAARTQLLALRSRAETLRRLLPEAQLLAPPDQAERAQELAAKLARLKRARGDLTRLSTARTTVSALLDVLRNPPPDDAAVARHAARVEQLGAELDRSFRARTALEGAAALGHAANFDDARAALDAQAELSPALEQQQRSARAQLQTADEAEGLTLGAWEAATSVLQTAQAARANLQAQQEHARAELAALDAEDDGKRSDLDHQLAATQAELQRLAEAARTSVAERALAQERRARAEGATSGASNHHSACASDALPLERQWAQLREAAEGAGVLHSALALTPGDGLSSLQLRAEAASKRELLHDRVTRTRGADELPDLLDHTTGHLECWLAVRAFLGRRVPAQIAEVADPLIALERLRDHLDLLETRLNRQEGELRGSSEDVARGIDVQLRRALGQVRRLNQQLEGIQFGSIHGMRIEIRRIERMEQILRALREGHAQELLFSSSLPIEDALEEIFKRYGGGGKSGGQRLLDYREYVELAIEIRRQGADNWEPANPTRLSTGEAIGVGAALMMVVLTEWERDANLLGPRDKLGSLRLLFLDEANRLSRDNLGVLFDLCHALDLQLIVAAPEVARADGNTTYRLVRHTTAEGREEVIVSGRRAVPPS